MTEKIDVLALAREAGFLAGGHGVTTKSPSGNCTEEVKKFAALVLERAAVECEKHVQQGFSQGRYSEGCNESLAATMAAESIEEAIRALKPNQ